MRKRIVSPREVLLVEIERRCPRPRCNARARVALTKEEARAYTGFVCGRCESRNEDALVERDIPDWWEELKVTALDGLRPQARAGADGEDDSGEVVTRMSDAWRSAERPGNDANE